MKLETQKAEIRVSQDQPRVSRFLELILFQPLNTILQSNRGLIQRGIDHRNKRQRINAKLH